ncbi:hypothetical protein [Paenibacillus sp. YYML68]|uniref:hypothetical protein n=1 Tax=Paenibacillus sp. YYML68 TaxID=2909250 RepID=UPI0024927070|nr:hypothetical protein [Paenibacillus sp. YYML68]
MSQLLAVEGIVTPSQSKTHITYSFVLEEPASSLELQFKYTPKHLDDQETSRALILEAIDKYAAPAVAEQQKREWAKFMPLQNLLTLSLDDPARFRGSAHRHTPEQKHLVCEEAASPGFIAGPMPQGVWKVTISVHCVVTPECSYTLTVKNGEGSV